MRVLVAAVVSAAALGAAGCALDAGVTIRYSGSSPVEVKEIVRPSQAPHRVHGSTSRNGQVVGVACSVTIVYDVREATGAAVLAQTYILHLRTHPLRRGTAYALDCNGPLVVELPSDATNLQATSTDTAGTSIALPMQTGVASVPIAFGKRLRPDPRTQLAVIGRSQPFATGEYTVELSFELPTARLVHEKAIATVAVSCGRARYFQPLLPTVTRLSKAPALTIDRSADGGSLILPRIAGAVGSSAGVRRTLSCPR